MRACGRSPPSVTGEVKSTDGQPQCFFLKIERDFRGSKRKEAIQLALAAARRTHHHPHGLPPHALPDSCCPLPTVRTRVPLPHTFARRCPAPSSLQGLYVGTTSAVILNSATFSGNTASQVSKDAGLPLSTPHTHTQAHTPSHVCADAPRTIAAESHEPPRTCPRGRLV